MIDKLESAAPAPDLQPTMASRTAFRVELLGGYRYAWCACGLSKYQPFCDGSHTSSPGGIKPVIWTQGKDEVAILCGCKRTKTGPICDRADLQLNEASTLPCARADAPKEIP